MKLKVAINGYGRIGRCILRALYESDYYRSFIDIVAINELADLDAVTHLTKYDTTHGRFPGTVARDESHLLINGDKIDLLSEPKPELLPWRQLGVDLVLECSGVFKTRQDAERHLQAGASKVLFSQPAEQDVDATIVFGVNNHLLKPEHTIVSNASCTTNAIIPVLNVLQETFGIECALITTIHSAMHDQPVIDAYDSDLRKTRSALQSIIPVETGLAKGVVRILPELKNRVHAQAIRVPTINVSMMDLSVELEKPTNREALNQALKGLSQKQGGRLFGYIEELLVSCDFNHDSRSSIVDSNQTQVCNHHFAKVVTWFDNEWGFANRMLDTTIAMIDGIQPIAD
ncbi:type I glyceraldehyde-3-phosphate dehydrogenase [Sedimenticola selenatireducens]|jgi:erythrose-4-phosphate dehydrogenase|uniref:Glyceraldehyde-3-phosphate dehydrogenase n=1 Tax=Sedimenticola selenatireducens TaxID=191960 RepID=A0A557S7W9_9GAMM|nr:type I glyceraldehyde-3-phosphate dehydrogenase [Sedimenticola selenatireducens]TVO73529.1 type I glyceraldehyde-3-phosphate dehydrogenase [Sedimenticola selenatireducens]TVT63470.1 MAG: type I glyceraldehyde-3-phosphate dehydrogenase [Sedimenticola selenatireducens]